jgi:hypothetical protein
MAFLAPLAAKGAAASLGTGLTAGSILGGGVGFKAGASLLAPTLGGGSLLAPTTVGLKSLGATLVPQLGGAGSSLLTGGAGSLLTGGGGSLLGGGGGALLGGGLPAGFGGVGLKAGVGSLIPAGFQVPGGAGLKSLAMANSPLAGGSKLVGQAGNISNQMYDQLVQQFGRSGLGQNLPQVGSKLAGPAGPVDLASGTNYLLNAPPKELVSLDLSQGANLANAVKSGGLRLPTGVDAGLKLTPEAAQSVLVPKGSPIIKGESFLSNFGNFIQNPSLSAAGDYVKEHPYASAGAAYMAYNALKPKPKQPEQDKGMIRPYEFDYNPNMAAYETSPLVDSREQLYFSPEFTAQAPYKAAEGGIMSLAVGGPVETMSAMNAIGGNMQYPQAGLHTALYSNPMMQRPEAVNVISPGEGPAVGAYSGEQKFASGGGISDLGGYSDGGRLLKGPGDGVSDSIPAVIGERQPARLADGEFVIPARIVSELGNGSTEAGARKLYAMMDRVQKARGKTVGKDRVAANTKADKHLPA